MTTGKVEYFPRKSIGDDNDDDVNYRGIKRVPHRESFFEMVVVRGGGSQTGNTSYGFDINPRGEG